MMHNVHHIYHPSAHKTLFIPLDTASTDWWFQHEEPNGDTLMQKGGPAYAANESSTASTNGTFWTAGYGMGKRTSSVNW
jgi:hypothetical protein